MITEKTFYAKFNLIVGVIITAKNFKEATIKAKEKFRKKEKYTILTSNLNIIEPKSQKHKKIEIDTNIEGGVR